MTAKLAARQEAIKSGNITYIGSNCPKCNNTLRSTANGDCVKCSLAREKRSYHSNTKRKYKNITRKFKISHEEYEWLFDSQKGKCANDGCQRQLFLDNGGNRHIGPNLDHHHGNGHIRGILCWWCNIALGLAHDDVERLRGLADYLEKSAERQKDFKEDILKGICRVSVGLQKAKKLVERQT